MANSLNPTVLRANQAPIAEPVATRDLLNTVFYYRRTAVLTFVILFMLGALIALLVPPSYTARARLLALNSRIYDTRKDVAVDTGPNATVAADVEMQILSSAELHREIIRRELGQGASEQTIDKQVQEFEDHLHISKLETGSIIEVVLRDRDPQKAANRLKQLLALYFEQRADVLTSGRVGFLTAQRDKVRAQLDAANAQIQAYQEQTGVLDVTAQIAGAVQLDGLLHQRAAEAATSYADTAKSTASLEETAKNVPKEVELFSDNTESARAIGTEQTQLFELQKRRADLASRYLPTSPFVQQVDAQIEALKKTIDGQKNDGTVARRTGYNAYHDTVTDRLAQSKATLAGASARRNVIEGQVANSKNRLKELIAISDNLSKLTSQRDLINDQVKDLSAQLEQARVQQNEVYTTGTTNVRVIEEPRTPYKRNNPPLLFIAASFISALLIAAIAVVVMSSLRETFLSPQEAQRAFNLPVFCDLPGKKGAATRKDFGRLIAALDSVPTGELGKTILLLTAADEDRVKSMARGLVDALEHRAPQRIALVRMEDNGVDEASDKPLLDRPMGLDRNMTLNMNMTRRRLIALFHQLRSSYDYTVVTAPPASQWFESLELSTVADLSVLVIQAAETRKPVAQNVLTQASYIGGRISGLAMTGRKYFIPSWLYRFILGGRRIR